ncbi:hypothetical protein A7982_13618 [Minicystis rosea]|nr:hypothetical protein A7982_13618 [Minicystis rosea]
MRAPHRRHQRSPNEGEQTENHMTSSHRDDLSGSSGEPAPRGRALRSLP